MNLEGPEDFPPSENPPAESAQALNGDVWTDEALRTLPIHKAKWPASALEAWEDRLIEMKMAGFVCSQIIEAIGGSHDQLAWHWRRLKDERGIEAGDIRKVKVAPVWGLAGRNYYSDPGDVKKWR